jgi:ribonuclease HII
MSKSGKKIIAVGIDEAGRGPLAGPLAVTAIAATARISNFKFLISKQFSKFKTRKVPSEPRVLCEIQKSKFLKNIRDSKKLSAKQREGWVKIICENFECKTAFVGPKIIDKIGIQKATRLAVARLLQKFSNINTNEMRSRCSRWLVVLDGGMSAPKHYNQETIIKGDEKVPLIAVASIIAKVSRDKKMLRLHKKFPQYHFDKHKGYGTRLHYKMLKKLGLSPIHRRTFLFHRRAFL